MASVCVTGGLGFVGSHLCRALAARGHRVRAVDALTGAYANGTGPEAAAELAATCAVEVVEADVVSAPLDALVRDMDAVVHLAALPGVRARHAHGRLRACNVLATARIASALGSGQRLVFASTSSIYGHALAGPTREDSPPAPLNPYARSKLAAESACLAAAERAGAEAIVARLFTVFGPGQRPDMAFARWIDAIDDGRPASWCAPPGARREFTYVADAARGLVAALEHGRAGEAYNVAGAGSIPVREALSEIGAQLGAGVSVMRSGGGSEATVTAACGRKAERELGYLPAIALRDGIAAQIAASGAAPARAAAAAAAA